MARQNEHVVNVLVIMSYPIRRLRLSEDITEALWGTQVSAETISNLNQKMYNNHLRQYNKPAVRTSQGKLNRARMLRP